MKGMKVVDRVNLERIRSLRDQIENMKTLIRNSQYPEMVKEYQAVILECEREIRKLKSS